MKRILFFLALGVSILIIYNLIGSITSLWQKRDLITSEQRELEKQKKGNQELIKKLKEAQGKEFVEKEARNKLFMVKEEENSLVIDEKLLNNLKGLKSEKLKDAKTTPQKWWDLFFGSS